MQKNTSDLFADQAETTGSVAKNSEFWNTHRAAEKERYECTPFDASPMVGRWPLQLGVQTDNMDPEKLMALAAGVDWLAFYSFGPKAPDELLSHLAGLKAKAEDKEQWIFLGGRYWQVQPYGMGKGLNAMRYVLDGPGVRLGISSQGSDKAPNAIIEATGQYCGGRDPQALYRELKRVIGDAGLNIMRTTITRLDLFIDVEGIHCKRVWDRFYSGNVVKRSRKVNPHFDGIDGTKITGIDFGKRGDGVFLRCYDKALELSLNDAKTERYLEAFDRDKVPEVLTRIEFEVSWEFLSETWAAQDGDAVFASLSSLASYLMRDWIRVCNYVDRNNTQLAKAESWWQHAANRLAKAARGFADRPAAMFMRPDVVRLKRQAMGLLAAIAAVTGLGPQSVADGAAILASVCTSGDDVVFADRVERRVLEFEHREQSLRSFLEAGDLSSGERNCHGENCEREKGC